MPDQIPPQPRLVGRKVDGPWVDATLTPRESFEAWLFALLICAGMAGVITLLIFA